MKTLLSLIFLSALFLPRLLAAEPEKPADAAAAASLPSGRELAGQVLGMQAPSVYVRFRLVVEEPGKEERVMQLQMRERRSGSRVDVMFQVLFPKERKGEGVVLHSAEGSRSGTVFTLPADLRDLGPGDMSQRLFGSDLAYADAVEPHFTWPQQKVVGGEKVDGVDCYVLESRPPSGGSLYALIRSWIDPERRVPLRIEKYDDGARLARRIDTLRVAREDGRYVPATIAVRTPGSNTVTKLEGSRSSAAKYADADFSRAALKMLSIPKTAD